MGDFRPVTPSRSKAHAVIAIQRGPVNIFTIRLSSTEADLQDKPKEKLKIEETGTWDCHLFKDNAGIVELLKLLRSSSI